MNSTRMAVAAGEGAILAHSITRLADRRDVVPLARLIEIVSRPQGRRAPETADG